MDVHIQDKCPCNIQIRCKNYYTCTASKSCLFFLNCTLCICCLSKPSYKKHNQRLPTRCHDVESIFTVLLLAY